MTEEQFKSMLFDENDPDEIYLDYFDEYSEMYHEQLSDEDLPKGVL